MALSPNSASARCACKADVIRTAKHNAHNPDSFLTRFLRDNEFNTNWGTVQTQRVSSLRGRSKWKRCAGIKLCAEIEVGDRLPCPISHRVCYTRSAVTMPNTGEGACHVRIEIRVTCLNVSDISVCRASIVPVKSVATRRNCLFADPAEWRINVCQWKLLFGLPAEHAPRSRRILRLIPPREHSQGEVSHEYKAGKHPD